MRFIEKINTLKASYRSDRCGTRDQAELLGKFAETPPLAAHMIFRPMPMDVQQHLIASYKRKVPAELLQLYDVMNGANLFWARKIMGKSGISIPVKYLSIFGVPLTTDRMHIEPFNISIEDLNRPDATPAAWLKFGNYSMPDDKTYDLFADTDTGRVYSVENRIPRCVVSESWESIDEALCAVYDRIAAVYEEKQ